MTSFSLSHEGFIWKDNIKSIHLHFTPSVSANILSLEVSTSYEHKKIPTVFFAHFINFILSIHFELNHHNTSNILGNRCFPPENK